MLAALYDIHGNLPALEAVLADVRRLGVRRIVVGGDVVPGPMPRECLDILRALDIPTFFVRGNGDRVVLAARAGHDIAAEVPEPFRDGIAWNARQIDDGMAEWMARWPSQLWITLPGAGDLLFCHASPRNDTDIFVKTTPADRLVSLFQGVDVPLVICGHTHMQFDRDVDGVRVVNAGSVGMSFQGVGAYWLAVNDNVELRRTDYDVDAAAARIRATRYPQAESFAAANVLQTPTEAAMLEAFRKVPLRQ